MPRRRGWLALTVVLALLAASCGDSDDEGGEDTDSPTSAAPEALTPQMGGKLVYGIDAESDGYNPVSKRFAQSGHTVASAVFDTLTTVDANGKVVPYLAESIQPNEDATVWTITLRDGVVFHTGEPLTAEGVATILEAHRTSLVTSSSFTPVTEVVATDERTVQVSTAYSWYGFPGILTTQAGYMFDPAMLTDPDSGAQPVGTGPFMFESWDRFNSLTVVRNPNYWRTDEAGNQLPYLDEIEFRIITDADLRNQALVDGDIDLLFTLTPDAILELRTTPDITVSEFSGGDEDLVALQTKNPPFDNVHARLAIAYATNQQAFRTDIQRDVYVPASGPWAPGQPGYRDDNGFPAYDPDAARAELEAYTADTGEATLSFTYTASDDVDNVQGAQYLADMWAEVGIDAQIEAIPQSDLIVKAVIGDYQLADWRNFSSPDPDIDQVWFHSDSVRPLEEGISVNIAQFADDEVDAALDEARQSDDADVTDEAYAAVAARFAEMVPYVWLGRVGWAMASSPRVHGWEIATKNGTVATVGAKNWLADVWVG